MLTRAVLAVTGMLLSFVVAGAAGAVVAAAVIVAVAGLALRGRYASAPAPELDLPDPPPPDEGTIRRLDRISGQLSIGMTDGRYFDRVVRPLILRIANSAAAAHGHPPVEPTALFGAHQDARRAPTVSELNVIVDRMELP
jgi:hypothetical protein